MWFSRNHAPAADSDFLPKFGAKFRGLAFRRSNDLLFSRPFAPPETGLELVEQGDEFDMAKTTRKVNKANHGRRPASSKARKAKRRKLGI